MAPWIPEVVIPAGKRIAFTSTNCDLSLPDPRYISLHAACAQVAHATGIAEYVDEVFRDFEELRVLPEDGSLDVLIVVLN